MESEGDHANDFVNVTVEPDVTLYEQEDHQGQDPLTEENQASQSFMGHTVKTEMDEQPLNLNQNCDDTYAESDSSCNDLAISEDVQRSEAAKGDVSPPVIGAAEEDRYQFRVKRSKWSGETLEDAYCAVERGTLSKKRASKNYGIPTSTLLRYINKAQDQKKRLGGKCIFSTVEEDQLTEYILKMENIMYGITSQNIRLLAYEWAERLDLPHNFNHDESMAGVDWLRGYVKRHADVKARKAENPNLNHTATTDKEAITQFYDNIEKVQREHNIPPDHVFNVDECGIATVLEGGKIFANRAKRRIGRVSNIEKGTTTTTICCMGATGTFISPMLIFKRLNCSPGLMEEAPSNFIGRKSHNGWLTENLFLEWLHHFQKETSCSITNKVMLISDHHSTHVSIKIWDFANANGIIIVPVPSHSNYFLHPLDITFFKPLQINYQREIQNWVTNHPGQCILSTNIAGIFSVAYIKTYGAELAISGFRAAGIVPFNRDMFSKNSFVSIENQLQAAFPASFDRNVINYGSGQSSQAITAKGNNPSEKNIWEEAMGNFSHYKRVRYDFHSNHIS